MCTNLVVKVTKGQICDGSISQKTLHGSTMCKVSYFLQKVHDKSSMLLY